MGLLSGFSKVEFVENYGLQLNLLKEKIIHRIRVILEKSKRQINKDFILFGIKKSVAIEQF